MRILKKSKQKNFLVDKEYYCETQLENMRKSDIIGAFETDVDDNGKQNYRVFACNCKEVKVICEDGYYNAVVITNTGEKIYIVL